MNHHERRKQINELQVLPLEEAFRCAAALVWKSRFVPATAREKRAMRDVIAALDPATEWWHGGMRGRLPGDLLLPPVLTGADPRRDPGRLRLTHVSVTTRRSVASWYAEQCGGFTYRVDPIGEVGVELLAFRATQMILPGFSNYDCFTCERARVLEVLE